MKTINLLSIVILFVIISSSCKENDIDLNADKGFSGYYKIVSIESAIPVDMNNDGIKSNNVLNEISGFHFYAGGIVQNVYNPNFFGSYAEVRPLKETTNDALLIDFNYPYQNILYEDEGTPTLHSYSGQFRSYSYRLNADNRIELIDSNPGYNAEFGKINSAVRLNEDLFQLDLTVKVFDFKDKVWVEIREVVKYLKVME